MFGKKEKIQFHIPDGDDVFLEKSVVKYIEKLERDLDNAKHNARMAKNELECIKPIVESKKLKPAVSKSCENCRYVVTSRWDGEVLGCRKDCVCEDFSPKE